MERIDGKYVHKHDPRNVLLAYVRQLDDRPDTYEAGMVHDLDHPFFFEHPLDHIPAMMLVEAGRQLGIAVSHLYLGVPLDRMFATRLFEIGFDDFAELHAPVTIEVEMTDRRYHRDELLHLRLNGRVLQCGKCIGTIGGSWSMLRPDVWRRYRRMEHNRLGLAGV